MAVEPRAVDRSSRRDAPPARTGTGRPRSGSTKPGASISSGWPPTSIRACRKDGALTRNRFCPATGNSPSDAQTYHELSPPESSLPGSPPRPTPNWWLTIGVHDLGRAGGLAGEVIRPRRFHVGLVVEPLEPVERVAGRHLALRWPLTRLLDRIGAEAEELVEQGDETIVRRRPGRCGSPCRAGAGTSSSTSALVERRVDEESGRLVERRGPASDASASSCPASASSPTLARHDGGAEVGEGDVERVCDRVGDAPLEVLLGVRRVAGRCACSTSAQSQSMPRHVELAQIGEERVGERAALTGEAVGAPRHAIADRQVALLLADVEQGVRELDRPLREQRRDQRELGPVDVPHRADVEHERPRRSARTGSRRDAKHGLISEWYSAVANTVRTLVVVRRRHSIAPRCSRHARFVAACDGCRTRRGASPQSPAQVPLGLLDAAEREAEPQLDRLLRPRPVRATTDRTAAGSWGGCSRTRAGCCPPSGGGRTRASVATRACRTSRWNGERRPFDGDLAACRGGAERLQVRAQRDGRAVIDREAAEGQVDRRAGRRWRRERVAVDRRLRADRDLAADAGRRACGVVAGSADSSTDPPTRAEIVERRRASA